MSTEDFLGRWGCNEEEEGTEKKEKEGTI